MPNYQNGKIYTIRHPDIEKYYLGSTTQALSERFRGHKKNKDTTVKQLFDLGIDQCYIELLENYPCNSKEELTKREGELIRLHKSNIVNRNIAGRTQKEWMVENKELISTTLKTYAENNKTKISEYNKVYTQANKEKKRLYDIQYRLNKKLIQPTI